MIGKLFEFRSKRRRWTYLCCAAVVLVFCVVSFGMNSDPLGLIPYIAIFAVCLIQFFHPTLVGWGALVGAFGLYTVLILLSHPQSQELGIFLLLGAGPTLLLLWSWPKAVIGR